MSIIYVHGVAVRDHTGEDVGTSGNTLLDRMVQNISWDDIADRLRRFVAPALSDKPDQVTLQHAYWGDLAARLAWDGASSSVESTSDQSPLLEKDRELDGPHPNLLLGKEREPDEPHQLRLSARSRVMAEIRQPLNRIGAQFFGDVFVYLNGRGDASKPGPIPLRMLEALAQAQTVKESTGEPIVVLTNSMGGQIIYDVVTHFLPRMPEYAGVKVDFWCSVAAQIGPFEEMKLFLASSPEYGKQHNNRVPFPDRRHLGVWWNVWDIDDLISYRVSDIIEGVDETAFHVGRPLLVEHIGYLQNDDFYHLFAERLGQIVRR